MALAPDNSARSKATGAPSGASPKKVSHFSVSHLVLSAEFQTQKFWVAPLGDSNPCFRRERTTNHRPGCYLFNLEIPPISRIDIAFSATGM